MVLTPSETRLCSANQVVMEVHIVTEALRLLNAPQAPESLVVETICSSRQPASAFFRLTTRLNSPKSIPAMSRASAFTRIGLLPSLVLHRVRGGDPGLASYLVVAN
jgi:hypothetical protein